MKHQPVHEEIDFTIGKIESCAVWFTERKVRFKHLMNSVMKTCFKDWLLIDDYIKHICHAYLDFTNSTINKLEHLKMDFPNLLIFEATLHRTEDYIRNEAVSTFETHCQYQLDKIVSLVPEEVKKQHPTMPEEMRLLKNSAASLFDHFLRFDFCRIRTVMENEIKEQS